MRRTAARVSAMLALAGAVAGVMSVPARADAQRATPAAIDTAAAPPASPEFKSPQAAAALGMMPGVGHIYAGEINRGWLLMAAYWTGYFIIRGGRTDTVGKVGGVMVVGGWLFGVVDGANAARRTNARLRRLRATTAPSDTTSARDEAAIPSSPRS
ncbi:MAG: hypothetical protein U0164_16045 [Gemmatimonadaceae bacterium]